MSIAGCRRQLSCWKGSVEFCEDVEEDDGCGGCGLFIFEIVDREASPKPRRGYRL